MATNSEPPSVTDGTRFDDGEGAAWYALTPQQRLEERSKPWETYLKLGGSLDPEPDSQSPFFDPAEWRAGARKAGVPSLVLPFSSPDRARHQRPVVKIDPKD